MPDADDYVMKGGIEDGLQVLYELSCGGIVFSRLERHILMRSKTGDENSFYLPKGHIKLIDRHPEDPLACALRETREELFLDDSMELNFNGFMYSTQEDRDFPKANERSYKTICFLGFDSDLIGQKRIITPDDKILQPIGLDEILRYTKPEFLSVVEAFREYIISR